MDKPDVRAWDWLSACLLFLLIQVAAARLVTTDWTPLLYFVETIAALGTVIGLALGASRFGRGLVLALAIGYTATLLPWQIAGTFDDELFPDRLGHAGEMLSISLSQFLHNQPVKEPLFFLAFVCLAFWIISLAAGYWLARHRSIIAAAVIPGAIIVVIQVYADYQPHASWWLAVYLLVALLLAGRLHYLQSRTRWTQRHVFVNEEAWSNIFGSLFMTTALAIFIVWLVPASPASLRDVSDRWNAFSRPIRERLSNAVSSLNGPYGKPAGNFYGTTLAMGEKAAAGDSAVFTVKILSGPVSTPRYYWRGRVYDTYADGQWSSLPASNLAFQPESSDLKIPDAEGRTETLLRFSMQFPSQSLVYSRSQAVWIDRTATVMVIIPSPGQYDILAWEATTPVPMGGLYEVKAEVSNPTIEQLRGAGSIYPQWISDRYLEVPEHLRVEIQTLSQDLTAGQSTEYDKAAVITDYLRANLQYATSVVAPPPGQDPIAWVLFSYKKGFCNYSASTEVLMLRSVGIPARLAVGFAQGDPSSGVYLVRRRDAHAWPEVYFPGVGWVEFEPTGNQAALVRPSSGAQTSGNALTSRPAKPLEEGDLSAFDNAQSLPTVKPIPFSQTLPGRALLVAALLLLGGILVYASRRYHVLDRLPAYLSKTLDSSGLATPAWITSWWSWTELEAVERSFVSINLSLNWLGRAQPMDATPAERARVLTGLMPSASEHIAALSFELESGLFTPRPADLHRARRASLFILMHAIRQRILNVFKASNGRDV